MGMETSTELNVAILLYLASIVVSIVLGMIDIAELAAVGYFVGSSIGVGLGYWIVHDVGKV
jgi:hypothetical protein